MSGSPGRRRARWLRAAWMACLEAGLVAAWTCSGVMGAEPLPPQPESATTTRAHVPPMAPVGARRHMVVAAHPLAAEAGREILRAGGSAVDAAIAVQLVLGLVEPQSSGLGGGAFLLHWDAGARALRSYDGRETAPAAARPDRFVRNGRRLGLSAAIRTGLAVGTPGTPRLIEHVHSRHGKLAWGDLFAPAIGLAQAGFPVSPRLRELLIEAGASRFSPDARAYFFDDSGSKPTVRSRLANPQYAQTLRRLADLGADGFYRGPIAEAIVAAVGTAPAFPGDLALADLAGYAVKERPAVCVPYRGNRVCSMGPPSSGGIALGQALMLLDGFAMAPATRPGLAPGTVHLAAEALKLAFADRNWYVADPDFAPVPASLTDPAYIAERRRLMSPVRTLAKPYPGLPAGTRGLAHGADATEEAAGTSHISIVDQWGNAVAMTTTIEAGFGSGLWAAGFLLNNELTDFSLAPTDAESRVIANRVEGGKRPRSSMAPVIVFDDSGAVRLVAGSAGGSRIIPYVLKSLIGVIDGGLDAQAAVAWPNFTSLGGPIEIEAPVFSWSHPWRGSAAGSQALETALRLAPLGQRFVFGTLNSGTHLIVRRHDGGLEGGADPRREGIALGD